VKIDINLLVILLAEIFALLVILWLIFHSEYVTHAEFISGTVPILGTMLASYWSMWGRISQISEDVGVKYLKSDVKHLKSDVQYLKSKTDKIELRMNKMELRMGRIEAKFGKMEEDIAQIKSDVKYLKRKLK